MRCACRDQRFSLSRDACTAMTSHQWIFDCSRGAQVCNGQYEAVEELAGKEIDAQSSLGCTALYLAAEEGHYRIVKLLLKRGSNVDVAADDGSSPLHRACSHGHEQVSTPEPYLV